MPATVVRGYALPEWVGPEVLVIVVSYSGETEEALACAAQARRARLCAGLRLVRRQPGRPRSRPRACRSCPCPAAASRAPPSARCRCRCSPPSEAAGLCAEHAADVAAAAAQLDADDALLAPGSPERRESREGPRAPAPRSGWRSCTARARVRRRRWKGQINENAKAPAFFNELPELDHNEIMGWTSLPHVTSSTVALFLHDESDEERLARRAELTAHEYEALGVATELVSARGSSRLARLFSLVQLGDYVSCYLALLYGVDPSPVDAIQAFKASLAGDPG